MPTILSVLAPFCAPTFIGSRISRRQQAAGKLGPVRSSGRDIFGEDELALAAHKSVDVPDGWPNGIFLVAGHCSEPASSILA